MKLTGVLVAGAVNADTIVRPVDGDRWGTTTFVESVDRCVGGNGANTSLALAKLQVPVSLAGAIGEDDAGEFLRSELLEAGVQLDGLRQLATPTAQTIVLVNGEGNRKFLHRMGAGALAYSEGIDFDLLQGNASHFHLASLFIVPHLRKRGAEFLKAARALGMTTSFDTNWDPLGRWMDDVGPLLPHLDLLFMNEDEARMVTGFEDPGRAAGVVRALSAKTAVMKLSNRGCVVFHDEGSIEAPAYEVAAVDSTGAGDCFVAGFMAALHRGADFREAAQFANAVGALSVQSVGAITGMRPYEEVVEWMRARVPGGSGTSS